MMKLGAWLFALFSAVFLLYSFLCLKQRPRRTDIGDYNLHSLSHAKIRRICLVSVLLSALALSYSLVFNRCKTSNQHFLASVGGQSLHTVHISPETTQQETHSETGAECQWNFVRYHPSKFEKEWREEIALNQAQVCERFTGTYKRYFEAYMDSCAQLSPNNVPVETPERMSQCSHPKALFEAPRKGFDEDLFSRFEYEFICSASSAVGAQRILRNVSIEPLAGILRHPKACTGTFNLDSEDGFLKVVDKGYLLLDGWPLHHAHPPTVTDRSKALAPTPAPRPRKFFNFDLGASTWTQGTGGASQEWFHGVYRDLCVDFDHFYAWEAAPGDTETVIDEIPDSVMGRYHWFNVKASAEVGHKRNPLTIMLSETKPEDFVLFKLDIDNWEVEEALVQQILESPDISSRIDEMFWEHHVNFSPMNWPWGGSYNPEHTMEYSINLFQALRARGIRAHSWV